MEKQAILIYNSKKQEVDYFKTFIRKKNFQHKKSDERD